MKANANHLTFGCDPELFLKHPDMGFVSAYGLFPGTKSDPFELEKGAVQVDGMALEFNIHPAKTEDEFADNIRVVLAQVEEMVKVVDPEMTLEFTPVARFDPQYFEIQPPECKILGCDPDVNVAGDLQSPRADLADVPLRTAAGHIHIGFVEPGEKIDPWSKAHIVDCMYVAQRFQMQKFFRAETLGEAERIKYYGANNPFRPKSYGVEMRGPSNLWVKTDKQRREMYTICHRTMTSIISSSHQLV